MSLLWIYPLITFEDHRLSVFGITLSTFPFGGYICGAIGWEVNERKYLHWKQHATDAENQAVESLSNDLDPIREVKHFIGAVVCLMAWSLFEIFIIIPF